MRDLENPDNTAIRFCPRCGSSQIYWTSPKELRCRSCTNVFFFNSAAAAGAIVSCRDHILLAVRRDDPGRDLLDLPGGFIDPGESAEEGLHRELAEELGLRVPTLTYLGSFPNRYPYRGILYYTLDIVFYVRLATRPRLVPNDDVTDFVWVQSAQIDFDRLAFASVKNALHKFIGDFPGSGKTSNKGVTGE